MSTVIDVSPKLGEYMLKGWVLTDDICKTCGKCPLMRTPAAYSTVSWYCASCDSSKNTLNDTTDTTSSTSSASVNGSLDHVSRPSTPPTEVSSTFSSPVFAPVDTEEILRRRQQSDLASVEIGKRMLKGWAMLADECPNSECFGIPLVRPPKAGGGKDPRKECVICHTIWVNRPNGGPLARQDSSQSETTPIAGPSRQLNPMEINNTSSAFASDSRPQEARKMPSVMPYESQQTITMPSPITFSNAPSFSKTSNSTLATLEASASALEHSLTTLTQRLNLLSQSPAVDPSAIGQTAEAISKVSLALQQVKELHWRENNASAA